MRQVRCVHLTHKCSNWQTDATHIASNGTNVEGRGARCQGDATYEAGFTPVGAVGVKQNRDVDVKICL